MKAFKEIIDNDNVEVARVNRNDLNKQQKVDKEEFAQKAQFYIRQNEIAKEIGHFNWQQKFEWVMNMKAKGNELYKDKKYEEALNIYMEGMYGLELKSGTNQDALRVQNELQIPLINNMATCEIQRKKFQQAIVLLSKSIELDPKNYKSIYKRATCFVNILNFENASIDFQQAIKNCEDDNARNQILQEYNKLKANVIERKNVYQKMFANQQDEKSKPDDVKPEDFITPQKSTLQKIFNLLYCCKRKDIKII